jgi:hypothetical protein
MANIRIGLGSEFNLKDQKLGLGTDNPQTRLDVAGVAKGKELKVTGVSSFTAYEGFLRADHQIAENTTLSFDQGPSASLSGEIIVGTGITVTVGLGTTVKDVNRAGGSEIECLKVYNTFTPPSGGTNERPYAPKPGELYYNYDFKTIEFHDGYGWRQVDNTTRSGRAVFAGGQDSSNFKTISYLNINSQGNEEYFGDLDGDARSGLQLGQVSSSIRGVFGAGFVSPAVKNEINYVTIASAGNALDFGDLSVGRGWAAAFSSSTRGIWVAGFTAPTSVSNVIDYVEIPTLGTALDFGDSSTSRDGAGGVSNPTRGIFGAGVSGSPFPGISSMEFVTISSKGDSVNFGDLTQRRRQPATACNSVRGIFAGGLDDPSINTYQSIIDFITMSSVGNAIEFGDLTINKRDSAGASTQVRAVFSGGLVNPSPTYTNIIDFITISSTGDAQDFGDSIVARNSAGSCSDSHGGLGGF